MITFHDVHTTPGADEILWVMLSLRSKEPNVNISHSGMPSREDHNAFVRSQPYHAWYLVRDGEDWIGNVNITQKNEVGIMLLDGFRGKGYGQRVMRKLLAEHSPLPAKKGERPGHFVANINPNNERSIRLFQGLGFKHIQNTYALDG